MDTKSFIIMYSHCMDLDTRNSGEFPWEIQLRQLFLLLPSSPESPQADHRCRCCWAGQRKALSLPLGTAWGSSRSASVRIKYQITTVAGCRSAVQFLSSFRVAHFSFHWHSPSALGCKVSKSTSLLGLYGLLLTIESSASKHSKDNDLVVVPAVDLPAVHNAGTASCS